MQFYVYVSNVSSSLCDMHVSSSSGAALPSSERIRVRERRRGQRQKIWRQLQGGPPRTLFNVCGASGCEDAAWGGRGAEGDDGEWVEDPETWGEYLLSPPLNPPPLPPSVSPSRAPISTRGGCERGDAAGEDGAAQVQVLAEAAETLSFGDVILAKCARERARERARETRLEAFSMPGREVGGAVSLCVRRLQAAWARVGGMGAERERALGGGGGGGGSPRQVGPGK
jgi:hypothetical protein